MNIHRQRFRNSVQLFVDICGLVVSWELTLVVRILLNPFLNAHVKAADASFWGPPVCLVLPIWLAISFRYRLYRVADRMTSLTITISAMENALILTIITALVTFFSREFGDSLSRMFVPLLLPVSFVVLFACRYLGEALTPIAQRHFSAPMRIALVGSLQRGSDFIEQLKLTNVDSFRGLVVPAADLAIVSDAKVPVLGSVHQLAEVINKEHLDRVIVLNSSLSNEDLAHCSDVLKRMRVPVSCALDFSANPVHMNVSTRYGLPFLELVPVQFVRRQEIVKRLIDIGISSLSLVLLSPLLFLIVLLIRLDSRGPVLYKAPRIGKGGRYFTFLKFRSMYLSTDRRMVAATNEKSGHIFKMKQDPRVTRVGRFLRRYSLDELPQLLNILRGEMSFVGPRPLPACDLGPDGMSETFLAWSEGRAMVHPGLTGLWQVSGRSDLPFEDMVRLDLSYVQNRSLALDLKIMLDTPLLVLRGTGAY